jgi:hypothetical protein
MPVELYPRVIMSKDQYQAHSDLEMPFASSDESIRKEALAKAPMVAELLRRAGYSEATIRTASIGEIFPAASEELSRQLPEDSPASPLIRLFFLRRAVEASELAIIGSKRELACLFESGLLKRIGT